MPCAVCVAGNDNGVTNATAANGAAIAALTGNTLEQYEFFNHLIGAGMVGGSASPIATGSAGFAGGAFASALPQAAFPQSGLTIAYGTHAGGTAGADTRTTHWLRASRFGAAGVVTAGTAILAPTRLSQLDGKYDDSIGSTGLIRGGDAATAGCGVEGGVTAYAATTLVLCSAVVAIE